MILLNFILLASIGCFSAGELMGFMVGNEGVDWKVKRTYLGNGIRLYNHPDFATNYAPHRNARRCAVHVDQQALSRVSKSWIPYCEGSKTIWKSEETVAEYIKKNRKDYDPKKTLRLSVVSENAEKGTPEWDDIRLVIPEGLLDGNGGSMGLTLECPPYKDNLPTEKPDWGAGLYLANLRGKKQPKDRCTKYEPKGDKKSLLPFD